MTTSSFSPQMRQRWWRWGSVLAYGDRGPGFEFRRRLNFFSQFQFSHRFFNFSFFNTFLGLLLSLPWQLANITPSSSFPHLPLEFLCKLHKVNKCLCSLSLSLLGPSYLDETGAALLQHMQQKKSHDQRQVGRTCRWQAVAPLNFVQSGQWLQHSGKAHSS